MGSYPLVPVGFMWYNSYPAQVFMGDTGSPTLGGIIAVFALAIRKNYLFQYYAEFGGEFIGGDAS